MKKTYKMYSLLCGLAIALAFSLPNLFGEEAAKSPSKELRVLSYNIHIGIGLDKKLDLERIGKIISAQNPDIVAVQEVDRFADRTEKIDEVEQLAKLTGMQVIFGKTLDHRTGGEYGVAIMSKLPIVEHKVAKLPQLGNLEERVALEVTVQLSDKTKLSFICTHFCHASDERRSLQAKAINEHFAQTDRLSIIAGDFNAGPEDQSIKIMSEKWTDATSSAPTWGNPKPSLKIDYIFYRPKDALRVKETRVIDEKVGSDHSPVLTVFEMP